MASTAATNFQLASGHPLIQITPQMRILVAIEAVDGRRYAPSIVM